MARILVIDDDKIMNGMIGQLLSEAGYEAEAAENGSRGLAMMSVRPFDLIITDIIMPEKEGLETISAIRKNSKTIPIIAISGGGTRGPEEYLDLAKHLGANHTFQKPFQSKAFLKAVQDCLYGDKQIG